jgi:alginate O-acetyltransferase complex protein AlgJ
MTTNGFIEKFNIGEIAGWVRLLDKESHYIFVSFDEGESFRVDIKYTLRADLKADCSAFSFTLPEKLKKGNNVKVNVYDSEGEEIDNSPVVIITNEIELDKVLKGKETWLFLRNDSNNNEKFLQGKITLDNNIIEKWKEQVIKRHELASILQAQMVSIVVPEKESVYPEFLPEGYDLSESRPLIMLKKSLLSEALIIPNLDKNLKSSDEKICYYKGDTHWNYMGAYNAFVDLMEELELSSFVDSFDAFQKRNVFMTGDLISKQIGVNVELVQHVFDRHSHHIELFNNCKETTDRRLEYFNPKAKINKKIMLWHTSSVDWMLPYILRAFSSVCLIWQKQIDWLEVTRFSPDIIVFQTNERFLVTAPTDINSEIFLR